MSDSSDLNLRIANHLEPFMSWKVCDLGNGRTFEQNRRDGFAVCDREKGMVWSSPGKAWHWEWISRKWKPRDAEHDPEITVLLMDRLLMKNRPHWMRMVEAEFEAGASVGEAVARVFARVEHLD